MSTPSADSILSARPQDGTTQSFRTFAGTFEWFHAIDLGDVVTRGRFRENEVQNRTLVPVFEMLGGVDVGGLDCLDVGTVDGIMAFALMSLGARSVTATDRVERESFIRIRAELALDIEYQTGIELATMGEHFAGRKFDLIVLAGVIYHMLNPFSAIQVCRQLVRPGGLLVVETATDLRRRAPTLALNSEALITDEVQTYWVPTPSAVDGMLRLGGFDPLDRREIRTPDRYSLLARACRPSEIRDRTSLLRAMQQNGYTDLGFDIRQLEEEVSESPVAYSPPGGPTRMTGRRLAQVEFPFHPTGRLASTDRVLGAPHASTRLGNRRRGPVTRIARGARSLYREWRG